MRHVSSRASRWIAAQGDDVADSMRPVVTCDIENLFAWRTDASEMWGSGERRGFLNFGDDVVSATARRAVGAISHRDETRLQRDEALDRLPQRLLHRFVFRRKEFERHDRATPQA